MVKYSQLKVCVLDAAFYKFDTFYVYFAEI